VRYVLTLLAQILMYSAVGFSAWAALSHRLRLKEPPLPFARPLLGILVLSWFQLFAARFGLPRTRGCFICIAACAAIFPLVAGGVRPRLPSSGWARMAEIGRVWRRPVYGRDDLLFLVAAAVIVIAWLLLALVTGFNLVPVGDAHTWGAFSCRWAFVSPLSYAQTRPPLTNWVEALNMVLLGAKELNSGLLALWLMHVVAIGMVYGLMTRLTNRWVALLLALVLTLSPDYVHNVFLGYRDALLAKMVCCVLLAAAWSVREPGSRSRSIALGMAMAAASLTKAEGLFLCLGALAVSGLALIMAVGLRSWKRVLLWIVPALLVLVLFFGGWHVVRTCATGTLRLSEFDTPVNEMLARFTAHRAATVMRGLWYFLRRPTFGLALGAMLVILPMKGIPKWPLQLGATILLWLALIFAIYMSTPAELKYHLTMSLPRVMFSPQAAAYCLILCACFARGNSENHAVVPMESADADDVCS